MLRKLMCPKTLIITVNIHPVLLHIRHQIVASLAVENRRDIRVLARRVAVLLIRAVTVIWPFLYHTFISHWSRNDIDN